MFGHITLERLVFDFYESSFVGRSKNLIDGENAVTEGCVRGKASVIPPITDVFIMRRVV